MNTELPEESKIFVKNKLTDLEKLLFAQSYINDLKNELSSQLIEISNLKIELGQLKAFVQELELNEKRTKEERAELRAISYNKALLEENKSLRERNKKLKRNNVDLVSELIKARSDT